MSTAPLGESPWEGPPQEGDTIVFPEGRPPARKNAFIIKSLTVEPPIVTSFHTRVTAELISSGEMDADWIRQSPSLGKVYLLTEKELAALELGARTIVNVPIEGGTVDRFEERST